MHPEPPSAITTVDRAMRHELAADLHYNYTAGNSKTLSATPVRWSSQKMVFQVTTVFVCCIAMTSMLVVVAEYNVDIRTMLHRLADYEGRTASPFGATNNVVAWTVIEPPTPPLSSIDANAEAGDQASAPDPNSRASARPSASPHRYRSTFTNGAGAEPTPAPSGSSRETAVESEGSRDRGRGDPDPPAVATTALATGSDRKSGFATSKQVVHLRNPRPHKPRFHARSRTYDGLPQGQSHTVVGAARLRGLNSDSSHPTVGAADTAAERLNREEREELAGTGDDEKPLHTQSYGQILGDRE